MGLSIKEKHVALLIWLFLGPVGGHMIYLRNWLRFAVYPIAWILGWNTEAGIFIAVIILFWLYDFVWLIRLKDSPVVVQSGSRSRKCNQCGHKNASNATFCNECGSSFVSTVQASCPKCETINEAGAKYCSKCGASIVGVGRSNAKENESSRRDRIQGRLQELRSKREESIGSMPSSGVAIAGSPTRTMDIMREGYTDRGDLVLRSEATVDSDGDVSVELELSTDSFAKDGEAIFVMGSVRATFGDESVDSAEFENYMLAGEDLYLRTFLLAHRQGSSSYTAEGELTVYQFEESAVDAKFAAQSGLVRCFDLSSMKAVLKLGDFDDEEYMTASLLIQSEVRAPLSVRLGSVSLFDDVEASVLIVDIGETEHTFWISGASPHSEVRLKLTEGQSVLGPLPFSCYGEINNPGAGDSFTSLGGEENGAHDLPDPYFPKGDGIRRYYMVNVGNKGGELVIGHVDSQFVRHWESKDPDDLQQFLIDVENGSNTSGKPFMKDGHNLSWSEVDDIEHINGVYLDSTYSVTEISLNGSSTIVNGLLETDESLGFQESFRELGVVYEGSHEVLYGREAYFQPESEDSVPVLLYHTGEVGDFALLFIETMGEFDPDKLYVGSVETVECEMIERYWYDGNELEPVTDFSSTRTKYSVAQVGWMCLDQHDSPERYVSGGDVLEELLADKLS